MAKTEIHLTVEGSTINNYTEQVYTGGRCYSSYKRHLELNISRSFSTWAQVKGSWVESSQPMGGKNSNDGPN